MNDLTFDLRQGDGRYLYTQIYEHIRQEIRKGKLPAGERLPSTRSLAEFLQVSRSTVELAYEQLVSEGYIEVRPCRGYFICSLEGLFDMDGLFADKELYQTGKLPEKRVQDIFLNSNENEKQAGKVRPFVYDFSPNAIDMSAFPFTTWKKITKNILVDANSEMFAAGTPQGDSQLRKTIARYLHLARGVNCTPEQIIVGAGNDYLLMLLEKILGRHVHIAIENPTYRRAYRIFDSFAYRISLIPLDQGGMSVKELIGSEAEVAYVMPSHQYPTGIVMPIGRRAELLKWASEQEGRYLIEDDYDSEFRFKGKPVPSLQSSDRTGKVIYMGTFSKSIAPAIRISYMVLPLSLLQRYEEKYSFYSSTVSRIDQRILNEFIAKGHFERHLNKMRKIYREKHDILLEELKPLSNRFLLSGEEAGLHILLRDKEQHTEQSLVETAADNEVKIYGLSEACVGEQMPEQSGHTVILGYAALTVQEIRAGVKQLNKAWQS